MPATTMVYRPHNLLGPKLIKAIVGQVEESQKAGSRAIVIRSGGVTAADEAMATVQAPIWASEDLKAGLASFRKNGPGLAKFAGR